MIWQLLWPKSFEKEGVKTKLRLCINYTLLNSSHISGYMLYPSVFIPPLGNHVGEIWKRSFISTVRLTVQIKPSRKRSFSKTLFKLEEFENDEFCFDEKHFENGGVRKRSLFYNQVISLTEFFPNTNLNWITGDCYVLKFFRRSVDGKHLTRFRNENSILKLSVVVSGWCLVEFSSGSGTVIRRYRQSVK